MDNIQKRIINSCANRSQNGSPVSVFDIIYDTGYRFVELKDSLGALVEAGALKKESEEYYLFTGSAEQFEEEEPEEPEASAIDEINDLDKEFCLGGRIEDEDDEDYEDDDDDPGSDGRRKEWTIPEILRGIKARRGDGAQEESPQEKPLTYSEYFNRDNENNPIFGERADEFVRGYGLEALKFCIESGQASVSLIQRNFPVGYIASCKIIDWMESKGYITAATGNKPRKVLITMERFKQLYGD